MTPIRQKVTLWIPYALVLLLVHCQQDGTTEPEITNEPISLAGKWNWSSEVISSNCELQLDLDSTLSKAVVFEDQGDSYRMRSRDNNDALAVTITGAVINFSKIENITTNNCTVTREVSGQGDIENNLVVGSLTTTMTHLSGDCNRPTCTVEEDFILERDLNCYCPSRAIFEAPASSEYILPFPAGESYYLSQSYCTPEGSHREQLHYDFDMPIGSEIVAARAGEVVDIRDGHSNISTTFNYLFIKHEDGTVAFYAHFTPFRFAVSRGDSVLQGQLLGLSGSSGSPCCRHLHFGVYQDNPPRHGHDVAVNFNNANGPLDSCGGLVWGAIYTAE
jgi:murein DD-endopeptidase MepM/ murein hydrolase activator NlpD